MDADAEPFPYLHWAKANLGLGDRLSLGLSGAPRPEPASAVDLLDPTATWANPPASLRAALAARHGVEPEQVHLAAGTSHANFACFLAFARGGRVVSETPTYEAFQRLGAAVGAETVSVPRRPEADWRLDADALTRAVTPGTSLIALTDLHNPSGAALHPADLERVLDAADAVNAHVLIDEVYLDLDPTSRPTAALASPRVLVTSSLTKAHGLSHLRCGWVLASPEAIRRIGRWDDLVCPVLPSLPMTQALRYLPHADERLRRLRARCADRTARVDDWVRSRADVRWRRPDGGFTGFLHLGRPDRPLDGDAVAARAWAEEGVRVVPGSFFQCPAGVRISYLLEEDALRESLERLGRALDRSA